MNRIILINFIFASIYVIFSFFTITFNNMAIEIIVFWFLPNDKLNVTYYYQKTIPWTIQHCRCFKKSWRKTLLSTPPASISRYHNYSPAVQEMVLTSTEEVRHVRFVTVHVNSLDRFPKKFRYPNYLHRCCRQAKSGTARRRHKKGRTSM